MDNYSATHGKKCLLIMAPEAFYVHGGLSFPDVGVKRGVYLPIIEA